MYDGEGLRRRFCLSARSRTSARVTKGNVLKCSALILSALWTVGSGSGNAGGGGSGTAGGRGTAGGGGTSGGEIGGGGGGIGSSTMPW